jgi:hypothetical protein
MSTPIPDFDSFVRSRGETPPRPKLAPASASPPVDAGLDSFVNGVMGEASRRTGYTYRLGEGSRTPEQQAEKVARGVSWTYNSRHLSGRARDVLAFDSKGNYITDGSHPAYTTLGEVYGELAPKSSARVKWGVVRDGRQVDPGHFELDGGDSPAPAVQSGPPPDFDEFVKSHAAENVPDFDEFIQQRNQSADEEEVVSTEATVDRATGRPLLLDDPRRKLAVDSSTRQTPGVGPRPLSQRQTFDPSTEEGRAGRDERAALERRPGAYLEVAVPLPAQDKLSDPAAGTELVRAAYVRALVARGVPESEAVKVVGSDYSLRNDGGDIIAPADAINDDDLNAEARTLRVRLDAAHLSKLADAYRSGRGVLARAREWAIDDQRSPGEKALDVALPVAGGVGKVGGYVSRPFQAAGAGVFAGLRGHNPLTEAGHVLSTGEPTAAGENPVGNFIRSRFGDSAFLARINPRLGHMPTLVGSGLGFLGDLIVDPSNLLMLGAAGRVAKVAGRMGRAAEEVGAVGRGLGLLERGIVEARPLGLMEEAGALRAAIDATPAGRVAALENRLNRVTEVARKLRAGEDLTPAEQALCAKVKAKHAPGLPAEFDAELRTAEGGRLAHSTKTGETVDLKTGEPVNLDAAPSDAVRAEQARYARERADFHAREAASAKSTGARENAQALADEYAQEAVRLESGASAEPSPEGFDVGGAPAAGIGPRPGSPSRPLWRRTLSTAKDVVQLPKAKAGFDLSATGRQGLAQVAAHPTYLKEAFVEQVKAFGSEDAFNAFVEGIRARPDFEQMKDAGLYLSHVAGDAGEEPFASGLAQRIPGVRASDRAYSAALDSIRTQAWDNYVSSLPAHLRDNPDTLGAVADLINISTGRGKVAVLDRFKLGRQFVDALNVPFFSPRNTASKFNLLSPARVIRNAVNPSTRPVAWLQMRDAFRGLGTMGTTLGLAHLAGLDVGLDPRSSDFGKLRVGHAVYDLSGGEGFTVRYLVNMGRAFAAEAQGKKLKPRETPTALTLHYLRSQLQPAAAVGVDLGTGKTFDDAPATYSQAAADLVVPFVVEDAYKGWVDAGGSTVSDVLDGKEVKTAFGGAARALPGVLGVGVNFYEKKEPGIRARGLMHSDDEQAAPGRAPAPGHTSLHLRGQRESTNVEDRRADGPFDDVVDEIQRAGKSPITETQAADAALMLDSLDEGKFLNFARNLSETGGLGAAGEGASAAFEYGARGLGALGSRDAAESAGLVHVQRQLARERRERPEQFARDALAGKYGVALRSEVAADGILPPPVHARVGARRASKQKLAEYARRKGVTLDEAIREAESLGAEIYDEQEQ